MGNIIELSEKYAISKDTECWTVHEKTLIKKKTEVYRLLLAAIFYPEQWRGSLFYTLRNLSFEVSQESETFELGGF
jgi:hypothetical protein